MPDLPEMDDTIDALHVVTRRRGICRRLRWKSLFMEVELGEDGTSDLVDDGFVWCTHSMNCLGPDGRVADKEECRPHRGCFED